MKNIWIFIGVVVLVLIIGYFTNWFGLKNKSSINNLSLTKADWIEKYYYACDRGLTKGEDCLFEEELKLMSIQEIKNQFI